jgi:hypothetical protein
MFALAGDVMAMPLATSTGRLDNIIRSIQSTPAPFAFSHIRVDSTICSMDSYSPVVDRASRCDTTRKGRNPTSLFYTESHMPLPRALPFSVVRSRLVLAANIAW